MSQTLTKQENKILFNVLKMGVGVIVALSGGAELLCLSGWPELGMCMEITAAVKQTLVVGGFKVLAGFTVSGWGLHAWYIGVKGSLN